MAREDEKSKKDSSKGFAGLSTLVSDVDTSQPPSDGTEPKSEVVPRLVHSRRPRGCHATSKKPVGKAKSYQAPPESFGGRADCQACYNCRPPNETQLNVCARPTNTSTDQRRITDAWSRSWVRSEATDVG